MSLGGADIGGLVGTLVFAGVAVKGLEVLGNVAGNVTKQPKKSSKKKSNNNIFELDLMGQNNDSFNFGSKKSKGKKSNPNDIFSTGFGF